MKYLATASLLAAQLVIAAPPAQAQEVSQGERLFRSRCASCHALAAGQNRIGPSLAGIFGRQAGTVEGARYSAGMRDSGISWNEQTLNDFMANPRALVPGTTMTIAVADAGQRGAITAFLQTQPATP